MFELDKRLAADCIALGKLELCLVLLMNDSQYPWLILVPQVEQIREIVDLDADQQQLLWQESAQISKCLQSCFQPHKLNVAALGNMVPQLHLHHIARFEDDAAWPKPVWGAQPAKAYSEQQLNERLTQLRSQLFE